MFPALPHRRQLTPFALLATVTIFSGCAGAAGGARDDTPQTIAITLAEGEIRHIEIGGGPNPNMGSRLQVTAEQAWAVLPDVFEELGLEAMGIDTSRRELAAPEFRLSGPFLGRRASDYVDCGYDPGLMRALADQATVEMSIRTTVTGTDNGPATLNTVVTGSARRGAGAAGRANCQSTGLLELIMARMVDAHAAVRLIGGGGAR